MAADNGHDNHVADPLGTVHHEIGSVAHGHNVNKSVWTLVIEQLILEKEPVGHST